MDTLDDLIANRPPTAARPLLGQTVLVVEDSRYACEAMRLMCLKSGARIRRASNLAQARKHLQTYRPGVVIVDIGLPDGSGLDLIADLHKSTPRVQVILGTSGDDKGEEAASQAGADGFLGKPIASLAVFQHTILNHLPADRIPRAIRSVSSDEIHPDPLALSDDLIHIADLLTSTDAHETAHYIAQFIESVAYAANDSGLSKASAELTEALKTGEPMAAALDHLSDVIQQRIMDLEFSCEA